VISRSNSENTDWHQRDSSSAASPAPEPSGVICQASLPRARQVLEVRGYLEAPHMPQLAHRRGPPLISTVSSLNSRAAS
jgi:hypothetical protein